MSAKKIVPCLDIKDGRVVKGVRFEDVKELEDPVKLAKYYIETGADELVFYDITASYESRPLFIDILKKTAREITVPLTVGGNIGKLDDFERVIDCGADKVSINTGALMNRALIEEASKKYGAQKVVLSMDVKRSGGRFMVYAKGGREETGLSAVEWAKFSEERGAGEIVLNSIDTDGVRDGFDIEMLAAVCDCVKLPVVASGGAGNMEHFAELFKQVPGVSTGLAATIFHTKQVNILDLKQFLRGRGVDVAI